MNEASRLDGLVLRWQERREQGQEVPLEELCAGCPELLEDLKREIKGLVSMEAFLGSRQESTTGDNSPGDTALEPSALPEAPAGYEILGELGRGGMGVVYRARRVALKRLVALKMILAGSHTSAEQLRRFRAEAEAAARLDHPGIVSVYEVGEHEGLPYFSMALVEGESLAQRVARGPLSPGEAAELVRAVARAIAYAHERGVIHRDLKPSNVLFGSDGQPRVADFGIAKRIDEDSGLTATGQVIGTPSYMAPEQAAGSKDVGPAADVYALGTVLYTLLVGRPPFQAASVIDTLNQVLHQEPVPPRRLNPSLPRDLETICLKCLEKETQRRYPSAPALAEDLGRFLNGEPVAARPVGRLERGWRWCRRNRVLAGLAATALAVLVAGTAVSSAFAVLAGQRTRDADRKAEEAIRSQHDAEENLQQARRAVHRYFTEVSENTLLNEPGLKPVRLKLLLAAREFYADFVSKYANAPGLRAELAKAHFRLGQVSAELDLTHEGIKYHQRAKALFEQLVEDHPGDPDHRCDLAATYHHLGRLYRLTSQTDRSSQAYERALRLWEQLVQESPGKVRFQAELARSQMGLGNVFNTRHKWQEAAACYLKALAIRRRLFDLAPKEAEYRRDLAVNYYNLASIYDQQTLKEKAREAEREANRLLRELVKKYPSSSLYRDDLARNLYNAGNRHALRGDAVGASASFQDAVALWKQLAQEHPDVPGFQSRLARTYHNWASLGGVIANAGELFRESLRISGQLAKQHPGLPGYQSQLANAYLNASKRHFQAGRTLQAEQDGRQALTIFEKLTREHPEIPEYAEKLIGARIAFGLRSYRLGREEQAEAMYRSALEAAEQQSRKGFKSHGIAHSLAVCRSNLADIEEGRRKPAEALAGYAQALRELQPVLEAGYRPADTRKTLRDIHWGRARALTQLDKFDEALRAWDRAIELDSGAQRPWFRMSRLAALAASGEHSLATKQAEATVPQARHSGEALYRLAIIYALASHSVHRDAKLPAAARGGRAQQYAARTVEFLHMARATGWFRQDGKMARLNREAAFHPLRERPDWKNFFRQLEADKNYPPQPGPETIGPPGPERIGPPKGKTLWDGLGGEVNLKKVIDQFVVAVAKDPKVNFFRGGKILLDAAGVARLKKLLVEFVSIATGGPLKYTGRSMRGVHKGMMITDAEFDALAGHLKTALEKNGARPEEVKAVLAIVGSTRKDIVEKKEPRRMP